MLVSGPSMHPLDKRMRCIVGNDLSETCRNFLGRDFSANTTANGISDAGYCRGPRLLLALREKLLPNGLSCHEIHAPKAESRDQGTQALAHPCARRSFAGGLAARLAPPVRP